jgi:hypothetical protein
VIEARDLVKRYGRTVAVDGLSFDVRPGTVTGFLVAQTTVAELSARASSLEEAFLALTSGSSDCHGADCHGADCHGADCHGAGYQGRSAGPRSADPAELRRLA